MENLNRQRKHIRHLAGHWLLLQWRDVRFDADSAEITSPCEGVWGVSMDTFSDRGERTRRFVAFHDFLPSLFVVDGDLGAAKALDFSVMSEKAIFTEMNARSREDL